ncbi:hypothetical protein NDU88_005800 [Pleurodeles waltl]|uniref:Uncharacterized protein n=1 Tax=Pleurodeles waltl TaxID=8319 RepID=A0AAV7UJ87_PLEWA|nr:hypothetical protein NDU88_005800 [Pleurodeles waltl]
MEHILQEITAVGRCLEAMDFMIADLSADSKSIQGDIDRFQDKVTQLDHRLTDVKGRLAILPNRDPELQFLRNKLTDLEDRSWRDNVCFLGILECKEGMDIRASLRDLLPELIGLVFSPMLEFQRTHRIGPPHKADSGKPRPITASFRRHEQAHQLIRAARTHGPYTFEGHEIHMAADFVTQN